MVAGPSPAEAASAPARQNATVSLEQVGFDLVLLGFLIALVLGLPSSESARLVPMMILAPTILGVAYQLYVDLTPHRHRGEAAEDQETPSDVRRRQLVFVAWLLAYFVGAWITSFLLMIPLALFTILRFVNGESIVLSLTLAAGMSAFIYVLFGVFLGVRF